MKLSDYVADFLARQGIRHAFAITGGASLHLIHSIGEHPGIDFICPQHEQAGAMAADAYSRVTGNLGVAIATSGPGATNLITGICCAFYDSVPALFLTGQVATFRFKGDTGVRQVGFQETDTVGMCQYITKYAVLVRDPQRIRYELEKACYLAKSGRPGPVLVDIPDDLQRGEVDETKLVGFTPPALPDRRQELNEKLEAMVRLLAAAHRPVLALGWGVRLAKADAETRQLAEQLRFPVVTTWAVADFLPHDHPLAVGAWGTHGTRHANFTIQNADLVLSIGSRLDTKATGSPPSTFAREAKKIIVDIDGAELNKFARYGLHADLLVQADAREFVMALSERLRGQDRPDYKAWWKRVEGWKQRYPVCPASFYKEVSVNPYVFVKELSRAIPEGATIFVDTGCAIAWMMQGFEFKEGQRLFHDFNNTAMGYALPASIGSSIALGGKPVICVTGDGSLQMNIQELITVLRHKLPIKIFLLNNHGHSMVQQTQEQWLGGKFYATSVEGGLAFPDFVKVAAAYGFPTSHAETNAELPAKIAEAWQANGPFFCNVEIPSDYRVVPQVRYGRALEDSEPLLDREEFLENMIVRPDPASLK